MSRKHRRATLQVCDARLACAVDEVDVHTAPVLWQAAVIVEYPQDWLLVRWILCRGRRLQPLEEGVGRDTVVEAGRDEHGRPVLQSRLEEGAVHAGHGAASVGHVGGREAHGGAARPTGDAEGIDCLRRQMRTGVRSCGRAVWTQKYGVAWSQNPAEAHTVR